MRSRSFALPERMTPRPLGRWIATACGLFAGVVAGIALFWAGMFALLRELWPRLPAGSSGALGLLVVVVGVVLGLGLYFVALRVVVQKTGGVSREAATGPAVLVGVLPIVGAVWLVSAIAIVVAFLR
jgi:hypothetical protein